MNPLSASDVFLTVAIMSVTFLTEVGLFILAAEITVKPMIRFVAITALLRAKKSGTAMTIIVMPRSRTECPS